MTAQSTAHRYRPANSYPAVRLLSMTPIADPDLFFDLPEALAAWAQL
jgi:hypothetical protein